MVLKANNILVKVDIKSRIVTVSGKRGKIVKNFRHLKVEITKVTDTNAETKKTTNYLELNSYLTTYKQSAVLYTVGSHIKNMFKGVTKGFRYKMHIVKKHFPIEIKISKDRLEIGRFLGEKDVKIVKLLEGVSVSKNEKNQEELFFDGIDIDKVSLTCKYIY